MPDRTLLVLPLLYFWAVRTRTGPPAALARICHWRVDLPDLVGPRDHYSGQGIGGGGSMGYSPNGDVQLTGEDLARARSFVEDAQEAILKAREAFKQLGSLVKSQLGDSRVAMTAEIAPRAEEANDDDGSVKVTYYGPDGRCLYVMEDPPGISRPCTDSKPGPKSPAPPAVVLLSE
jgi:hypothetical protein